MKPKEFLTAFKRYKKKLPKVKKINTDLLKTKGISKWKNLIKDTNLIIRLIEASLMYSRPLDRVLLNRTAIDIQDDVDCLLNEYIDDYENILKMYKDLLESFRFFCERR